MYNQCSNGFVLIKSIQKCKFKNIIINAIYYNIILRSHLASYYFQSLKLTLLSPTIYHTLCFTMLSIYFIAILFKIKFSRVLVVPLNYSDSARIEHKGHRRGLEPRACHSQWGVPRRGRWCPIMGQPLAAVVPHNVDATLSSFLWRQ